jgi:glycosyltransferase involved in cell wall biosynthesis
MISIITCIYNQNPNYFMECIKSIESQDAPTEWIIVDDGSEQRFLDIYNDCLSLMEKRQEVSLIKLPRNMGLSFARNEGIKRAKYDWVVVLDSDDQLAPSLCKNLMRLPNDVALVNVSVEYFNDKSNEHHPVKLWRDFYKWLGKTIADPFLWFDFYYHGIIAKRRLLNNIGGYKNCLKVGEDQDILLRACEALDIENVHFLEDVGYYYRRNHDGLCLTQWHLVEENYCTTMVEASRRRGSLFLDCKFTKGIILDNAMIDMYIYKEGDLWITWFDCLKKYFAINPSYSFTMGEI